MNKSKKFIIALIAVLTAVALFLLGVMSLFIAGGDKLEDMLDKREDDLKTVVFQKEYSINDFQNMKIDCGRAKTEMSALLFSAQTIISFREKLRMKRLSLTKSTAKQRFAGQGR